MDNIYLEVEIEKRCKDRRKIQRFWPSLRIVKNCFGNGRKRENPISLKIRVHFFDWNSVSLDICILFATR